MDETNQALERVKGRWAGFFDSTVGTQEGLGCVFALVVALVLAAETFAVLSRRKKLR